MVLAVCDMLEINDPFTGSSINKSDLGLTIVFVDIFVIIFVLAFTWTLEIGQENFVNIYDEGTIEMSDFSLRVKKMPEEKDFFPEGEGIGDDPVKKAKSKKMRDEALRALLYNHFS